MAVPATRADFIANCLRRLGAPVTKINIDQAQLDDAVDYALAKFRDYHFDGTLRWYIPHQITAQDQANAFITLPASPQVIDVIGIFDLQSTIMGTGIWNVQYQFVLNNLDMFRSIDMTNFVVALQNLQFLQQILVGKEQIRFQRYGSTLYVDMDWNASVAVGDYLIVDCYIVVDPSVYPQVWSDPWLQQYAAAIMKKYYGTNLKKYDDVPLLGGVKLNGQKIYDEAVAEIEELESKLLSDYSMPVLDMIG